MKTNYSIAFHVTTAPHSACMVVRAKCEIGTTHGTWVVLRVASRLFVHRAVKHVMYAQQ